MNSKLIEKDVVVRVRNEKTGQWDGRTTNKIVQTFDMDYGRERKERQNRERQERLEEWQSLSPEEQLRELNNRLGFGVGATKQRARIKAQIEEKKERFKQEQAKKAAKEQQQAQQEMKRQKHKEQNRRKKQK